MFEDLKVDPVFEPFIGTTYSSEGHQRILFVSFDEWVYLPHQKYTSKTGNVFGGINEGESLFLNIRHLFRSSSYFEHIKDIFKAINCGLTEEDIAFHNFLVRPTIYPLIDNKPQKPNITKDDLNKAVKVFKAVMDFCNPDLLIFCCPKDKKCINQAFDNKLDEYLRDFGVTWLDNGNLDYDIRLQEDDTCWATKNVTIQRAIDYLFRPGDFAPDGDSDPTNYDFVTLDFHKVPLQKDETTPNLPEELQQLAAFISDETKRPGSFILRRYLHILRHLKCEIEESYDRTMDLIEEISSKDDCDPDFYSSDPICQQIRPGLYDALHILTPLIDDLEKNLKPASRLQNKTCCKYTSEKMRIAATERSRKKVLQNKKMTAEQNFKHKLVKDEIPSDEKIERNRNRNKTIQKYYQWLKDEHKKRERQLAEESEEIDSLQTKENLSDDEKKRLDELLYKHGPDSYIDSLFNAISGEKSTDS